MSTFSDKPAMNNSKTGTGVKDREDFFQKFIHFEEKRRPIKKDVIQLQSERLIG